MGYASARLLVGRLNLDTQADAGRPGVVATAAVHTTGGLIIDYAFWSQDGGGA
jgi:hypothetical protein